ncbi:hypothetical protein NDU88_005256 [Pleurodeles waltl]|uniref:Uncharacterized protein n=1 Tax=Pleurodeles waltl TaxID=8319 RepID=A0AAV7PIC7_PLEWA|nr:hypothetical protein NDU88_005256 [Pleurodeles waltl]
MRCAQCKDQHAPPSPSQDGPGFLRRPLTFPAVQRLVGAPVAWLTREAAPPHLRWVRRPNLEPPRGLPCADARQPPPSSPGPLLREPRTDGDPPSSHSLPAFFIRCLYLLRRRAPRRRNCFSVSAPWTAVRCCTARAPLAARPGPGSAAKVGRPNWAISRWPTGTPMFQL